ALTFGAGPALRSALVALLALKSRLASVAAVVFASFFLGASKRRLGFLDLFEQPAEVAFQLLHVRARAGAGPLALVFARLGIRLRGADQYGGHAEREQYHGARQHAVLLVRETMGRWCEYIRRGIKAT